MASCCYGVARRCNTSFARHRTRQYNCTRWIGHNDICRRGVTVASSSNDDYMKYMDEISKKYSSPSNGNPQSSQNSITPKTAANRAPSITAAPATSRPPGNGVFLLLLVNVAVFIANNILHLPACQQLFLNHASPKWWQFLTSAFCHGGWEHLSGNMFNLLIFGKLIEETEGAFGVWFTYIVTAVGGAVALYLTTPAITNTLTGRVVTVSMGASGAVFGMFAVAVLLRLKWNLRSLLEAGILGQFVIKQVLQEVRAQTTGGLMVAGHSVAHMAHLGGAFVGVLLVLLLTKLPDPEGASA